MRVGLFPFDPLDPLDLLAEEILRKVNKCGDQTNKSREKMGTSGYKWIQTGQSGSNQNTEAHFASCSKVFSLNKFKFSTFFISTLGKEKPSIRVSLLPGEGYPGRTWTGR